MRAPVTLFILAASALLLASCPSPLTRIELSSAKDDAPPVITITSPAENSSFGRTIVIDGRVADTASASGLAGSVSALSFEILAHTLPQPAVVGADGTFQIMISTTLTDNIVIELRATDWNGNTSTARLPLTYEGNDIPTFQAQSGNRKITLTWDPVPGVSSYTLYFEPSSLAPTVDSVGRREAVSSPYVFVDLDNGQIHSFLLRGHSTSGSDNYSQVIRSVALSSFDLFPTVTPYFNRINVDWRPFPGISQYEVMRATSPDGEFRSASGPVSGGTYTDTNVQQGVTYYYAVKPALYSDTLSEAAEAIPDPFSTYLDSEIGLYKSVTFPVSTAVKGHYLYVADYYGGLRVADISRPTTPLPVATVSSINAVRDVAIDGDRAYVAHGQSLSAFDISDPASPVLLDTLPVTTSAAGGQAEGVSVLGSWAFVACFNDGFSVVDVSDPGNLSEAYHYSVSVNPDALAGSQFYSTAAVDRSGTTVLFVTTLAETAVYTVTGPAASPTLTFRSKNMPFGYDIDVAGSYAYLASGWYLEVWDTATLTAPFRAGQLQPDLSESTQALDVADGRAYVTIRDTGFSVIDVSTPSNPVLVQSYTTPGDASGITVSGGCAYVADGNGYAINIFGVATAESASLAGSYATLVGATHLAVARDHVLVTETRDDWALSVIDAAVPSALSLSGSADSYSPLDLEVAGRYAVFAAERMGIMIWNIADPSAPTVLQPWYVNLPGGNAVAVDVEGAFAYVATAQSMLNVVDLTWENNLSKVGSVYTQANHTAAAADVVVRQGYAFVANSAAGLRVVDVRDPRWPSAVTTFGSTAGSAVSVALSGDYALVGCTDGLYVFNVANPRSVSLARGPGAGGGIRDVVVRGNFAYLAKGAAGIQMMDITDPAAPVPVLSYVTPTPAERLAVSRDIAFVIDGADHLYAVDLLP